MSYPFTKGKVSLWTTTRYFYNASSLQPVYSQAKKTITHRVFATNTQKLPHKAAHLHMLFGRLHKQGCPNVTITKYGWEVKDGIPFPCIHDGPPDPN